MLTAKPFATGVQAKKAAQTATKPPQFAQQGSHGKSGYAAYAPQQASGSRAPMEVNGQPVLGSSMDWNQSVLMTPSGSVPNPNAYRPPAPQQQSPTVRDKRMPLPWEEGGQLPPGAFMPGQPVPRFPGNMAEAYQGQRFPSRLEQGPPMFNPGNFANMPPSQRPPAFQQTAVTPFGQMDPSQFFNARNDFVANILQKQNQVSQNAGVFNQGNVPQNGMPNWGNPQQFWPDAGGQMIRELIARRA